MRLLLNLSFPGLSSVKPVLLSLASLKPDFTRKDQLSGLCHFEVLTALEMCTAHGGKVLSSTPSYNIFLFLGLRTPSLILVCWYGVCFDVNCILGEEAMRFSLHHVNRLCSNKVRKTVKTAIVLKEKKNYLEWSVIFTFGALLAMVLGTVP